MGHKNNPTPAASYNTALTEAKVKTPGEIAVENASAKALNWADKRDFRNPGEGGLFVNYTDPALIHEHRDLEMNAGDQGIFALGTADPNYLQTVKEHEKAQQERMDAGQYESDIKEGVQNAAAAAGDAERMDAARKLGVLNTTADIYGRDMNRPKWWNYAISGASAGLSAIPGL